MQIRDIPLISVIIPCFNLEMVIGKCLDSICSQTYANIEIIVVDDGSSDGSRNAIKNFAVQDARIKLISQENKGVGSAYNAGLNVAAGDYIYILDGDNYVDSDLLEVMYTAMREYGSDVVICDYYLDKYMSNGEYVTFGSITYPWSYLKNHDEIIEVAFDMYRKYILQSPCNKLYKAEILSNCFFDEDKDYMMIVDSGFNVRLLEKINSLVSINKKLVHYVQYDLAVRKQITSMWRYKYRPQMVFCEKRMYAYWQKNYLCLSSNVQQGKMQELNNYFAGRFIKIAQVLLLDADLPQQQRNVEFSNLRQIMVTLIKQRDISYMIYRMMYWLLIKEKKVILTLIYKGGALCALCFPKVLRMLKAG